jgi:mannose/fructose/N-acetylgalactosamine-specific phosphotransferase system component IID
VSALVRNERLKLQAAALDRASTADLAIGILGPLAGTGVSVPFVLAWLTGALALHLAAYWVLGGLRA